MKISIYHLLRPTRSSKAFGRKSPKMKIPQDGAQWREISFNEFAAERFVQSQWSKKQSCSESQELSIGIKQDQITVKFTPT